ncbi:hypothetical protein GCK32_022525 [Trichostrongylus colubriformis]|uniref:Uncharacterized protein n=1 Tax=Trichostrongylus colubriformis TaxID=6319 RepID=A0AAN8FFP2_TRICO
MKRSIFQPRSPPPEGVAWFVDELAVIKEEGPDKRRSLDGDSTKSSRSDSVSKVEKYTMQPSLDVLNSAEEEKKIESSCSDREKNT